MPVDDSTRPDTAEENATAAARETNPRKEMMRDQILDTAARMFDETGYDRCSMAMIAQAVGLGRSAVYHYFGSKEEMLAALIEAEAFAPSNRLAELPVLPDSTASELLRIVVVEGVVRRLTSGSRFVRLSRLEGQIPEHLRRGYDRSRREIYDYYLRCIEHGIQTGEFRPVDAHVAAFSVIGMANWTSRWFRPEGRLSAREVGEAIADMALAALRTTDERDRMLNEARDRTRGLLDQMRGLSDLLG